jgi:hypothetical protein
MNGYYKPAKRLLARDNLYGIIMLRINDYLTSQKQITNTNIRLLNPARTRKLQSD